MFIEISQFYIKSHFAYFLQQTDMATRNMNSNPKGPNILITGMWYCNKSMRWVIQKLWLISGIWFHLWQTFSSQKIPIFLGHCCCVFVWNDCLVVVGLLNELPLQKGKFIGLLAWFYVFNFNLSGCWFLCSQSYGPLLLSPNKPPFVLATGCNCCKIMMQTPDSVIIQTRHPPRRRAIEWDWQIGQWSFI